MITNPFTQKTVVTNADKFIGRKDEVGRLLHYIETSQSCTIIGERRIGKSSLMNYISNPSVLESHNMEPKQFIFAECDFMSHTKVTFSQFWKSMFRQMVYYLNSHNKLKKYAADLSKSDQIMGIDLEMFVREVSRADLKLVFLFDGFEILYNINVKKLYYLIEPLEQLKNNIDSYRFILSFPSSLPYYSK